MMFRIPYELIPLVAVIWLTARHFYTAHTSERSKRRLCGLTALAVVATPFVPLAASLSQVAICVYILLYQMVVCEVNRKCHQ